MNHRCEEQVRYFNRAIALLDECFLSEDRQDTQEDMDERIRCFVQIGSYAEKCDNNGEIVWDVYLVLRLNNIYIAEDFGNTDKIVALVGKIVDFIKYADISKCEKSAVIHSISKLLDRNFPWTFKEKFSRRIEQALPNFKLRAYDKSCEHYLCNTVRRFDLRGFS